MSEMSNSVRGYLNLSTSFPNTYMYMQVVVTMVLAIHLHIQGEWRHKLAISNYW